MGEWVFYQEGWRHANLRPYSYDFATLADKMCQTPTGEPATNFRAPEATVYWQREVLPELNRVRVWLLDNAHAEEMERIKAAYYDQWLGFVKQSGS